MKAETPHQTQEKGKNKRKNKHKQSFSISMMGVLLITLHFYSDYKYTARLLSISTNNQQLSVKSKLGVMVNVTNRTAATSSMTMASSCANISVHNTHTIQKKLHGGTYHVKYSGLFPKEEMALEQSILKRIETVCGCTHHFPKLFKPFSDNNTMISTHMGTPSQPLSHPPVGLQEEDAVEQVGTIIQCLYKSRVRHLDLMQASDNPCKNMVVKYHSRTNTYRISLFDFDIAAMDEIFQSLRLQKLSDEVASNFKDYLSFQHHHMMAICLGFKNYTLTESLAATTAILL